MIDGIICASCGKPAPRRGPSQRYCVPCSDLKNLARQTRPSTQQQARQVRSASRARGQEISSQHSETIMWDANEHIDLEWYVRVAIPFSWAVSKNHIYALNRKGHVHLRQESTKYRGLISHKISKAIEGRNVVTNKLWLDIFVQKPSHNGDAVNVIDTVCDAVKTAAGVDDRWFSIRRLDWQIVKNDPRLFIGIGQTATEHARICSYCGRSLPTNMFRKKSGDHLGIGRECKDCLSSKKAATAGPSVS